MRLKFNIVMRFQKSKYSRAVKIFLSVFLILCLGYVLSTNKSACVIVQQHSMKKLLPFQKFHFPLDIDLKKLEEDFTNNVTTDIKPINVLPFSYKDSIESCDSTERISLLFMIKSAPGNFDQRQVIRETWVNNLYFENYAIRHVFLVARTMNGTIYNRLSLEKEIHHDIVEMTFIDDYYNSTYKTTGGINWCVKYCPTAQFIMLVDDDFYVATDRLLKYLNRLPQGIYRTLFVGREAITEPQRCPDDKWFISIEDYPFYRYPFFVSGGAVIMSMDFAKRLQIVIPFTKWFKFDDVFLGIVAYKLGVKPIHHPEIHMNSVSYKDDKFKTVLASHGYGNPNQLKAAWFLHIQTVKANGSV